MSDDNVTIPDPTQAAASPQPSAPAPDAELRQRLIRQFEGWLDRMLANELPPEGLPAELLAEVQGQAAGPDRSCDLYSLFSALTALTGEIRLQGRSFKQLADALAPLGDTSARLQQVQASQAALVQQIDQLSQQQDEAATLPPSKDVLEVLFDLHGRLQRNLHTIEAAVGRLEAIPAPGRLARLFGAQAGSQEILELADAMREGAQLTLARVEAALHQWGIEPIGVPGEPFAPDRMTAVEIQETDDAEDGAVVEVYRNGYMLYDEVLATAQVKVARAKSKV